MTVARPFGTHRSRGQGLREEQPGGFLAGVVDGHLAGLEAEDMLRHAVGCATANALVWDAGAIEVDEVRRLAGEVVVEVLNGR